jgi:endonuclease IV
MTAHIKAAIAEAKQEGIEMRAAAIFVGGPRNRALTLRHSEATELKQFLSASGVVVIAHGAYPDNEVWTGSLPAGIFIRSERELCQRAGIGGLVIHLPAAPPSEVLPILPSLYTTAAPDVKTYLEIPAVSPSNAYYASGEDLGDFFRQIRERFDADLERVGLCLDTAHLWTSGVDLASYAAAEKWLEGLEAAADAIPPESIMLHLNDSQRPRGTGPDAHAGLAAGKIWGAYRGALADSGLAAFVDYAVRNDTVTILERKPAEKLADDYRILYALAPSMRAKESPQPGRQN